MTSRQPLYVRKLTLKNIRCFEHLEIEFEEGKSIVIIGDNGDGKSTVLRALAMGLCDQSSAQLCFVSCTVTTLEVVRAIPTVRSLSILQDRGDLTTASESTQLYGLSMRLNESIRCSLICLPVPRNAYSKTIFRGNESSPARTAQVFVSKARRIMSLT